MEYFDSILYAMNVEVEKLIENNKIDSSTQIVILGLDEYSFAIRTLLANHGFEVQAYVSEDEDKRELVLRRIRSALSRYFNKTEAYIRILSVEECFQRAQKNQVVLYASQDCSVEIDKIKSITGIEDDDIYCVYDWKQNHYTKTIDGLVPMTLEEMKEIEKEILRYLDQFCKKHHLRYWLSGGSMLGTVRHKGFIPWDDDIDVFMPDVDYEKFLELFEESDILKCQIVDDENDVWGHYKFARLANKKTLLVEKDLLYRHMIGVNVEILPIVGLPKDEKERIAYIRRYEKINARRKELFFKCNGDMDVFRSLYAAEQPVFKEYRFDESEYVGVLGTGYYEKDCTTRSVYESTLRMPFEDIMVNIPQGYQEYLDNLYGKGWEEWPPEEKRKLPHNIEAYWL